jgi:xeroderma pigmentosum group C-complementing protein
MSLVPLSIQSSFLMIHKSRIPDAAKRGRVFETSIMRLVEWWAQEYFQVEMTGHIRNKTFDEVQKSLAAGEFEFDRDGSPLYVSSDDRIREHEIVKSPKSLMKHALTGSGSRDVSAQLFTAVCRALDIPARLVASLQSVPWQAGVGKPKHNGKRKKLTKGKGKATELDEEGADANDNSDDDDDMEEVSIPSSVDIEGKGKGGRRLSAKAKGKQVAAPVIRLRKSRPKAVAPKLSRASMNLAFS